MFLLICKLYICIQNVFGHIFYSSRLHLYWQFWQFEVQKLAYMLILAAGGSGPYLSSVGGASWSIFFWGGCIFRRGQLKEIALYKNVLLSLLCILPKCRRHVGGEERRGTYWLELYNWSLAWVCDGNTPGLTSWLGTVLNPPGALKAIGDPLCQITTVLN